jgi:hypothetical protein
VALVRPLWRPHPSNVDVLSLKRKELRESSLVSLRAPLSVTSILDCTIISCEWIVSEQEGGE